MKNARKGRTKKTCDETVREDMKKSVALENAQDRDKLRGRCRLVDPDNLG